MEPLCRKRRATCCSDILLRAGLTKETEPWYRLLTHGTKKNPGIHSHANPLASRGSTHRTDSCT